MDRVYDKVKGWSPKPQGKGIEDKAFQEEPKNEWGHKSGALIQ